MYPLGYTYPSSGTTTLGHHDLENEEWSDGARSESEFQTLSLEDCHFAGTGNHGYSYPDNDIQHDATTENILLPIAGQRLTESRTTQDSQLLDCGFNDR